jgi:hypothetical protein
MKDKFKYIDGATSMRILSFAAVLAVMFALLAIVLL